MSFRLIFLILFYSQILSQTTLYVKYRTVENASLAFSEASSIITNLNQNLTKNKQSTSKISTLTTQFGELNTNLARIVKYEIASEEELDKFLNKIKNNSSVEYIHTSSKYYIDAIPSDSLFSQQWSLKSINAINAWELFPQNSKEIIIAVIDTGIDYLHPDLTNILYKNKGEVGIDKNGNDKSINGIDDDDNGFIDDYQGWDFVDKLNIFPAELEADFTGWDNDPSDEHGHGTNISGVIGAEHNKLGIAGAHPNAKIMNLRAFDKNGTGEEDDAAAAIIYAVKMGAKIINMSWGDNQYSKLLKDVIEYAYENGVVLVGSSGNSSSDDPHYPSGFSYVISVGAIQENNAIASFSNYGSTLDLVAPGSQIITTNLGGSYKTVSGTSVSAPFVSAASAMLAATTNFSNEEIKQILKSTAIDLGDNGWDEFFGAGNLDMEKALKILSPSEIKINNPVQDYFSKGDSLEINITCISPYFKDYNLLFGKGNNPNDWEQLSTGNEKYQTYQEDVYKLDISKLPDTTYTVRILVNRIDGNTLEERVNFTIDRTPPEILNYNFFPAMLNEKEILQASIITDEPVKAKLYYRESNSNEEFKFVYLDGFNGDLGNISQKHFGFLPIEEQLNGFDHEFYFELINQSNLKTILKDEQNYFSAKNIINIRVVTNRPTEYSVPNGRIYPQPLKLNGSNENFILLNENETSSDITIYKLANSKLEEVSKIKNRIPVSVNDFNKDGKTDILSLYVKNGYIETQIAPGNNEFQTVFSDSSGEFWPAYADDIDNDEKFEIIVFSSDTTITIFEVGTDFSLRKEAELKIFVSDDIAEKSIFRNNNILVDNFDDDLQNEIVTLDNYGRLILYQINGSDTYANDKIIEHFYPIESNSKFTKGDFNGDGRLDIAVLMEFEENIFETPLIYCSIFSLNLDDIELHFQNMFITTENSFVSSFEKQYTSILLEDLNQNDKDDLIVFAYPNSYIFEDDENPNLLFYQKDVNSQSIFVGDLDDHGIKEVGIPSGDKLYFQEFSEDGRISPPIITDYYSLDSNRIYIEWNISDYPVFVSRIGKGNSASKPRFTSVSTNSYIDTTEPNLTYDYLVEYHNPKDSTIISKWSNIVTLHSHAPGKVRNIVLFNNNKLEISFTQPIETKNVKLINFLVDNDQYPSSVSSSSEYSYILTLPDSILEGNHSLTINNLRDYYNTPYNDTTISFKFTDPIKTEDRLFITNYSIIDNYNLIVNYNLQLDDISALNIINYTFRPNNLVKTIIYNSDDKKSIKITTTKPFGSIGKEYILKVENIFSSVNSGYLPIGLHSGSEIVLSSNAENLDDIYVYPNPIEFGTHNNITFANLPPKVDIYIYSIDGIFVKMISEEDGNGGVSWNLQDENNIFIGSGIYFYKAISLDNLNNKIQEKIGKFAVIK